MIIKDGREVSICKSSSLACGKVSDNWPRIGETASPGKAFNAEIDQIPISVMKGMVPCPVLIRMFLSVGLVGNGLLEWHIRIYRKMGFLLCVVSSESVF